MQDIFFATGNAHKLEEIEHILEAFVVKSFKDLPKKIEVEETEPTLEGNAALKAKAYYNLVKIPCFADDTGLEVKALNGRPGVETARYAGPDCNAEDNKRKLLEELENVNDRSATFRTVIAWFDGQNIKYFSGELNGIISEAQRGKGGFGYDPVFIPEGQSRTLAQFSKEEKNSISHRARALAKFIEFLKGK